MKLFSHIEAAVFRSRPNRFVLECSLNSRTVRAYLPNPGRLWELLFPGAVVYLTPVPPAAGRKFAYMAVAVERNGAPVMLHTHYTNAVAESLIRGRRVPALAGAEIVQPEHRVGNSRFDFLLTMDGRDLLLEVKSCTLFHRTLAMFPDAVSARATKHLLELARLSRRGVRTAVLFIVHAPWARFFMPEHHTDLEFSRTLLAVKDRVLVKAVSVEWEQDLTLGSSVRSLAIPWDLVERESHDRGCAVIVLRLRRDRKLALGGERARMFPKGYYLSLDEAAEDLSGQIARRQRQRLRPLDRLDQLRQHADFHAAIPIRSSTIAAREIVESLSMLTSLQEAGIPDGENAPAGALFRMDEDPLHSKQFIERLLHFRMGTLEQELASRAYAGEIRPGKA